MAAAFVLPQAIGSVAAIIAVQNLVVTFLSLGVPVGLRRFIGASRGKKDDRELVSCLVTSFKLLLVLNVPFTILMIVVAFFGCSISSLTSGELYVIVLLILLNFWPVVLVSVFNSILRTGVTARAEVISAIVKLIIGSLLMYYGFNSVGLVWGFIAASFTVDSILVYHTLRLLKKLGVNRERQRNQVKDLVKSGLPSWIPYTLTVLGQSIGVLGIYGVIGGFETGLYYVAFVVASVIYTLPASIGVLMLPVLSGMEHEREEMASRAIRLSLAVTAPLALVFALYPFLPFALLGSTYAPASPILVILMLGALLYPIAVGYESYIYAIGKYVHVTVLGLTVNLSRLLLYTSLIPNLGGVGAAISYSAGLLFGLVPIVVSARLLRYKLGWVRCGGTILIPTLLAVVFLILPIPWILGIPSLTVLSLIVYTRLGIITRMDLREIFQAFMSEKSIKRLSRYATPFLRVVFG